MHALGRVAAERGQVEDLDHVQLLQEDVAAGVGRHLVDFVAAIVGVDGLGPVRAKGGQIARGQVAVVGAAIGVDGLGDVAFVESGSPLRGKPAIGAA